MCYILCDFEALSGKAHEFLALQPQTPLFISLCGRFRHAIGRKKTAKMRILSRARLPVPPRRLKAPELGAVAKCVSLQC